MCIRDRSKEATANTVLSVNASMSPTKIYVTAEVNGEPIRCLLDSGCERSVISADLVPNAELTASQYTLYAANRANLNVLGDCVISFVIDGHHFEADVSVSNKVEEFLLGSDWLEKYGAKWDFAVEPQGIGPGVMTACTLFSDGQTQLTARVLNHSLKPITLKVNSLLSTAEPVQCISGSGSADLSDVSLVGSSNSYCLLYTSDAADE